MIYLVYSNKMLTFATSNNKLNILEHRRQRETAAQNYGKEKY